MKQPSFEDRRPLAVTQGDPAGVGPLITLLAWQVLRNETGACFYVIADPKHLERAKAKLGLATPLQTIAAPADAFETFAEALPVLPINDVEANFGVGDPKNGPAVITSIEQAVRHVKERDAAGVVTNPISKKLLYDAGFSFPGHTEFLASLTAQEGREHPRPIMMLVGGGLKVSLATIHMPLRDVANTLSEELLSEVFSITYEALRKDFGINAPRLAICGLNPHAGEERSLGHEDADIIAPAITAHQEKGMTLIGPRPGDTVFREALDGAADAVVAMYHDQGLIPVKTLDMWGGVNVTLGLPIVRTSPDHGTGYDAARSGDVRADSLIAAIRLARQIANNRAMRS